LEIWFYNGDGGGGGAGFMHQGKRPENEIATDETKETKNVLNKIVPM